MDIARELTSMLGVVKCIRVKVSKAKCDYVTQVTVKSCLPEGLKGHGEFRGNHHPALPSYLSVMLVYHITGSLSREAGQEPGS